MILNYIIPNSYLPHHPSTRLNTQAIKKPKKLIALSWNHKDHYPVMTANNPEFLLNKKIRTRKNYSH